MELWILAVLPAGSLIFEDNPTPAAATYTMAQQSKVSNIIYVDQPTGTGFSYSTDLRDLRFTEKGVANDLYDFLQAFCREHPHLLDNDFYITGESYAGHYIAADAERVHEGTERVVGFT